ncbi:hypothetical protein ACFQZT_29750 [Paenibacillus sp. GCM10027628]|uniref:hypothetical protein n=1 Tax=Paenibacillus sp. GCM10027628 TaxID=3273413 RepID=UPI0036298DF2
MEAGCFRFIEPDGILGWILFILAGLLGYWANIEPYPWLALRFIAAGILVMGLFHARIGTFGKKS